MNFSYNKNDIDINIFFPFFIKTDEELVINEVGKSMDKLLPNLVGFPLHKVFKIRRPNSLKFSYGSIADYQSQLVVMQSYANNVIFRWQVQPLAHSKELLFVGGPWITTIDTLNENSITINDFAVHDSMPDMFQLLRTHEINSNEISNLVNQLSAKNDLLQKVIDLMPHKVFLKDARLKFKIVNKNTADFYGKEGVELIGRDEQTILSDNGMSLGDGESDAQLIASGQTVEIPEHVEVNHKGEILHYKTTKIPFEFESGEKGILGVAIDITEAKKSESRLKESEDRYRMLVEGALDIIYRCDRNGHFNFVNQQAAIVTGFSKEELLNKNFLDLLLEEYVESTIDYYRSEEFVNAGNQSYYELPMLSKSGDVIWIGQKVLPILSDGEITGYQAVARDVTELKRLRTEQAQTEEELRETTSRLKSLIENLNAGILVEDENRRIVSVNQAFCDMFQVPVPPKDLIGIDCSGSAEQSKHLFKDPQAFIENIDVALRFKIFKGGEKMEMENGRVLERDYIPIYVKDDYRGHLWYYKDITREHEAQKAIHEQKKFYEYILNSIPSDLVVWNEKHQYLFANPVSIKNNEIREWIIGKDDFDYVAHKNKPQQLAQGRRDKFSEMMAKKRAIEWEEKVGTNGNETYMLRKMAPVFGENGKFEVAIGYGIDITERKRMELELQYAKEQAEESSKAKEQFLSTISHEIRTPLNAVVGMTQLLLSENPKPEQMEYINAIKYSSGNLLSLINDILDFSKIESGKIQFEHVHFDLYELVQRIQNIYRFQAEEKGLMFNVMIETDVNRYLCGDTTRLIQILTNLVGNAIKFTEQGQVSIIISKKKSAKNAHVLTFEVRDTGIGISKQHQEKIFERFTQANSDTTRKYGGTGLGLTITKLLVELQSGKIWLKSSLGKGTSFFFDIPFELGAKSQIPVECDGILKEDLSGFKILLVEDNRLNQVVASRLLQKWGLHIEIAENGEIAVAKARANVYDLILMDLQMPVMDGYTATRNIRIQGFDRPIIALTASASIEVKDKVKQAGMNDYLPKPFEASVLLNKLKCYLKGTDHTPQLKTETVVKTDYSLERYKEFSGGDDEFVKEMIKVFLDDTPDIIARLEEDIRHNNSPAIAAGAHKLKSSFGFLSMNDFYCKKLESDAKNNLGKTDEYAISLKVIRQSFNDVSKDLKQFL